MVCHLLPFAKVGQYRFKVFGWYSRKVTNFSQRFTLESLCWSTVLRNTNFYHIPYI